jgi:predicted permease
LWHRELRDQELAEELEFHRRLAEQEQRERGLDPATARRAASLQFGNEMMARESARHIWFPAAFEGLLQDVRYACRGLSRSKALLAVACLSLGLSTGFGTALFSVVNAVILQPVTAKQPESLLRLWIGDGNRISEANLRDVCEDTPGVACAGYTIDELSLQQSGEPERVFAQNVSANYFDLLGIEGSGRWTLTPDTVVLTHAFWQRHLGGDPHAMGRLLVLSGRPYTVTGILPRGFRSIWGLGIAPSVYLTSPRFHQGRGERRYEMLARLGPGQTIAEFRSRVLARAQGLAAAYPAENREFGRVQTFPFHRLGLFLSSNDQVLHVILLFAAAVLVFVLLLALVACVNVAGLLVARALARQREIVIRLSIGCGRMRLARLLLTESLMLAVAGVGMGALFSVWLARVLVAAPLPFPIPFELEVPVDWRLLAYLAALVGLATVLMGVAPVLQAWRLPAAAGYRRWSLRGVLIASQVAISTVLLIAMSLFVRSLWVASRIDPGFDLDRVVNVEVDTKSRPMKAAEVESYYRRAFARVRRAPGVTAVSLAHVVPLTMNSIVNSLLVDRGGKDENITVNSNWVLPEYFQTMGIPMRTGRDFDETDRRAQPLTAIVNESFARRVFPGRSALGQRVRRPAPAEKAEPWAEIIAVVADSRYLTLGEETRPQVYWPFGEIPANVTIHVRTEADTAGLTRALPDVLREVDARVPVRVRPLRSVMSVALFPAQVAAIALASLGLVGWGLTVAGLYGLVSYSLSRRIPEIGVRVALGASPGQVTRLLLRDGLKVSLSGLAVGLVLAALATPLLGMFLAGVPPHDIASFGIVALALGITAFTAGIGPARRGARMSPLEVLRNE